VNYDPSSVRLNGKEVVLLMTDRELLEIIAQKIMSIDEKIISIDNDVKETKERVIKVEQSQVRIENKFDEKIDKHDIEIKVIKGGKKESKITIQSL